MPIVATVGRAREKRTARLAVDAADLAYASESGGGGYGSGGESCPIKISYL